MLKRLIEVALPLKEVSEQSAREKSIRHGHISTLHIWWARRPLGACRAVVFASLIPDPDDPECPDEFRKLVMDVLRRNEFKPTGLEPSPSAPVPVGRVSLDDTPRNRCIEFIKYLVRWENSNNPEYIEPARKLIAAGHTFLHPDAKGDAPKVLDPFAGGGAIPLEALRLGCESHAVDLNPVAHLIELCTLVYPQKYGQPDSRPVPDYIKRLVDHNQSKRKAKGETGLFDTGDLHELPNDGDIIPEVDITEEEYRNNPLAADVKYWGYWAKAKARQEIGDMYPLTQDGAVPVAYLWARTVTCPNPSCGARIPLIQQLWLTNRSRCKVALKMDMSVADKRCTFCVKEGEDIDFDPKAGTMQKGRAKCPFCEYVVSGDQLRSESKSGRMGHQMIAVVSTRSQQTGKFYGTPSLADERAFAEANSQLEALRHEIPNEPITPDRPSPNSRGLSAVVRYGMDTFGKLFNPRQSVAMSAFVRATREAVSRFPTDDEDYRTAVACFLAISVDRLASFDNAIVRWANNRETAIPPFSKNGVPMLWDYAEVNPFSESTGDWNSALEWVHRVVSVNSQITTPGVATHASATAIPIESDSLSAVITDPPYYDAVPYSDLSDFFYVWMKRTVGERFPDQFRTPLTPKGQEVIAYYGSGKRNVQKTPVWYEQEMQKAFYEMRRVTIAQGVLCVMFAHKSTSAWDSLITGLLRAGQSVTASWPLHTERPGRLLSIGTASLASSVTLVCRKRPEDAGDGLWDDVRQELKTVAKERLDFFWDQGIRGADFFISAIGPALSVFGRYARVIRISGEEVTVGEFLDEVRALVTNYALTKILHTTNTANIDPESRFYVVWKWSYGDAKVPADESFKLAQALGIDTEVMWDKTGVLTKSGENVQCLPIEKRMKVKDLGEPEADGTPSSLIDVLHRMCVFRDKGDNAGMAQFLSRSGQARNGALWLIAQAVSEILPDGEREKQLMQGLLNQQEGLEEATRQGELF